MNFLRLRKGIVCAGALVGWALFWGCSDSQPAAEPPPPPPITALNICENLPFDCRDPGALPCQQTADCACLADFCDGVEGSVVPVDLDISKVQCCEGGCLDFSDSPVATCEEFLQIGISCPSTGLPAPECTQASNCEAIVGVPGFYSCEIFCCVLRLPNRVGDGAPCVNNAFVEPQCDFGMRCVEGICQKVCGDDGMGQAIPTCDQLSWFGPEATCENNQFGPCEAATGCCGPPLPPGPCDPFPACGDVGNDCPSVGLVGDCMNPEDCCSPP